MPYFRPVTNIMSVAPYRRIQAEPMNRALGTRQEKCYRKGGWGMPIRELRQ